MREMTETAVERLAAKGAKVTEFDFPAEGKPLLEAIWIINKFEGARAFGYDAVERLGRENCTVAALRDKIVGMDLSAPKVDAGRAPKAGTTAITYGEMKERMASIMRGGT